MDPALDAGDVVARKSIPITQETYISDVLKQAEEMVPALYEEAVAKVLEKPDAYVVKGTTEGSRCYPRLPEDGQISWNQSAENISRLVRANSRPYKGAFSFLNGEKITIWKAKPCYPENKFFAVPGHVVMLNKVTGAIMVACSEGMLEVQEIEKDGEVITPTDFIKSIRVRFKEL
jgi:methionyl-tRNA formyltransferase